MTTMYVHPMERFPHYFSTYCIHRDHENCRLTCKTCQAECQCPCHWANTSKHPEAEHRER